MDDHHRCDRIWGDLGAMRRRHQTNSRAHNNGVNRQWFVVHLVDKRGSQTIQYKYTFRSGDGRKTTQARKDETEDGKSLDFGTQWVKRVERDEYGGWEGNEMKRDCALGLEPGTNENPTWEEGSERKDARKT